MLADSIPETLSSESRNVIEIWRTSQNAVDTTPSRLSRSLSYIFRRCRTSNEKQRSKEDKRREDGKKRNHGFNFGRKKSLQMCKSEPTYESEKWDCMELNLSDDVLNLRADSQLLLDALNAAQRWSGSQHRLELREQEIKGEKTVLRQCVDNQKKNQYTGRYNKVSYSESEISLSSVNSTASNCNSTGDSDDFDIQKKNDYTLLNNHNLAAYADAIAMRQFDANSPLYVVDDTASNVRPPHATITQDPDTYSEHVNFTHTDIKELIKAGRKRQHGSPNTKDLDVILTPTPQPRPDRPSKKPVPIPRPTATLTQTWRPTTFKTSFRELDSSTGRTQTHEKANKVKANVVERRTVSTPTGMSSLTTSNSNCKAVRTRNSVQLSGHIVGQKRLIIFELVAERVPRFPQVFPI
eukprot:CFRG3961T1